MKLFTSVIYILFLLLISFVHYYQCFVFQLHLSSSVSMHKHRIGSKTLTLFESNQPQNINNIQDESFRLPNQYFFSQKSFESIGMNQRFIDILHKIGILNPSKIQALSFRTLYQGNHSILGEQTGSGKTLAYLIPVLQRIHDQYDNQTLSPPRSRSPHLIIMTPTIELANQVSTVVKEIGKFLNFRTSCFTSATDNFDNEDKRLRLGIEVLVTTAGRLEDLLRKKDILVDDLQTIVLDEADVLYSDKTFPLQKIGSKILNTTQFIFTSATWPEEIINQIKLEFPEVVSLTGPGLHKLAPNVDEELIDCSDNGPTCGPDSILEKKKEALLRTLESSLADRIIIFCNSIEKCRFVENVLSRYDRNQRVREIYPYHAAIDQKSREYNLESFCKPLIKMPVVLICTDRASRGLDFNKVKVDHVVLFDFPSDASEYLRRIGRTGRVGRKGKASVFVFGKQVSIARTIMKANSEGLKIDPSLVPSKDVDSSKPKPKYQNTYRGQRKR